MFKHNWVEAIIVGGWVNKVVIPSWIDMVISSFKDGFIYIYIVRCFHQRRKAYIQLLSSGSFPIFSHGFPTFAETSQQPSPWPFKGEWWTRPWRWAADEAVWHGVTTWYVLGGGCKWYINQSNNGDFDQEKLGLKIHHLAVKIEVWKLNNKTCGLNNQTLGFHLDDPLVF